MTFNAKIMSTSSPPFPYRQTAHIDFQVEPADERESSQCPSSNGGTESVREAIIKRSQLEITYAERGSSIQVIKFWDARAVPTGDWKTIFPIYNNQGLRVAAVIAILWGEMEHKDGTHIPPDSSICNVLLDCTEEDKALKCVSSKTFPNDKNGHCLKKARRDLAEWYMKHPRKTTAMQVGPIMPKKKDLKRLQSEPNFDCDSSAKRARRLSPPYPSGNNTIGDAIRVESGPRSLAPNALYSGLPMSAGYVSPAGPLTPEAVICIPYRPSGESGGPEAVAKALGSIPYGIRLIGKRTSEIVTRSYRKHFLRFPRRYVFLDSLPRLRLWWTEVNMPRKLFKLIVCWWEKN